ncbi:hypothetical protein ACQR1I_11650 [Bradyrhizobium sp. HKCCYLS2038]|uniref:hypothetical protein n=1 Tax=unclassified Bradyrhizobium TaxID=2631580 RepID=UPI003EB7DB9C
MQQPFNKLTSFRLRELMTFVVVLSWIISAATAMAQGSAAVPQFKQYLTNEVFRGKAVTVVLNTPEKVAFRTRLREAGRQQANFAGHYVLTTWGCGDTCLMGAAVDRLSGQVTFLPATTCCWGELDPRYKPVEFRLGSRLLVLSGQLNEKGVKGDHFFEFKNGEFTPISTIPDAPTALPSGNPKTVEVPLNAFQVRDLDGATATYVHTLALSDQDGEGFLGKFRNLVANSSFRETDALPNEILLSGLKALVALSAVEFISAREHLLYNPQAQLFLHVEISPEGQMAVDVYSLDRIVKLLGPLKPEFKFDDNPLKNSIGFGGRYLLLLSEEFRSNSGRVQELRKDNHTENGQISANFAIFLHSLLSTIQRSKDNCSSNVNAFLADQQKLWRGKEILSEQTISSLSLTQILDGDSGYRIYTFLDEAAARVYVQIAVQLTDTGSCKLYGHPIAFAVPAIIKK